MCAIFTRQSFFESISFDLIFRARCTKRATLIKRRTRRINAAGSKNAKYVSSDIVAFVNGTRGTAISAALERETILDIVPALPAESTACTPRKIVKLLSPRRPEVMLISFGFNHSSKFSVCPAFRGASIIPIMTFSWGIVYRSCSAVLSPAASSASSKTSFAKSSDIMILYIEAGRSEHSSNVIVKILYLFNLNFGIKSFLIALKFPFGGFYAFIGRKFVQPHKMNIKSYTLEKVSRCTFKTRNIKAHESL